MHPYRQDIKIERTHMGYKPKTIQCLIYSNKVSYYLQKSHLKMIYNSIIYGITVWGAAHELTR